MRSLSALGIGLGFAITAAAIAYEVVAATSFRRLQKREQPAAHSAPPAVTVLKPLAGLEAELYENLCSFVDQSYPQIQVIFGVAEANDPAAAIAERVIARFPHADVSLVIGDGAAAPNPKVANLAAMLGHAKHEMLVIADADMRVDETYLNAVVGAFDDSRVGAVTCLYSGTPAGGCSSTLGAMYINEQFAPSVLVANLVEPLTYCFGSTMAVRRSVLKEIGGLAALGDHIGDDYLLGKLVTERGYRVALAPYVVRNIVYEPDMRALVLHELRWARTVRAQRPAGYALLFITQPLFCASMLALATRASKAFMVALLVALAARLALNAAARDAFATTKTPLWMIPVRDTLTAAVWLAGFFTRGVRWRDRRYAIGADGRAATSLQQIRQNSSTR